jgi:hypothetical protein
MKRKLHNEELFIICTLHQHSDKFKKDEMDSACSMYGRGTGMHTKFWPGNLKEGDQFRDFGVDERIILKWI